MSAVYQYIRPGRRDVLTMDDAIALWLMRMCVGEGGVRCPRRKAAMMMWAMVNRWFLHPGRKHWPTFLYMVRRFSQPINPRWQKGGDLAKRYAKTDAASPARLRRRAYISSMPAAKVPEKIRAVVKDFCDGLIPYPETRDNQIVTNWASLKSTPKKYHWGFDVDGDWFFEDRNIKEGYIRVLPATRLVPL